MNLYTFLRCHIGTHILRCIFIGRSGDVFWKANNMRAENTYKYINTYSCVFGPPFPPSIFAPLPPPFFFPTTGAAGARMGQGKCCQGRVYLF